LVINGKPMFGQVNEIIKSEAGLATLMDIKVNTGRLDPLTNVLTRIGTEKAIQNFSELAAYEHEIVSAMRYRKDYLKDSSLTKPSPSAKNRRRR
jgi:hypothetical protein